MPKQTVIRPSGVITQPNEYGELPPGTLSVGDNIQIRRTSVIEPRNAFEQWQAIAAITYKMWAVGDEGRVLRIGPGSDYITAVCDGSTQKTLGLEGPDSLEEYTPGKTHLASARDRVIFTYQKYPVIWDPNEATPPVAYTCRQSGLTPLLISDVTETTGGSIWLTGNYVAYAAVLRRTESDGYVVRGAASTKLIKHNDAGADRLATVRLTWPDNATIHVDDVIELYRVPQQNSADLLGDEYRLALEYEITSADITAGYVDILDTCLETALSTYMYTNPSQLGADKTYLPPPPSSDVVTFKKVTFYTTTSLWHQVATRIPNKWGALSTADEVSHGIGSRSLTGNFTNLSSTFTVADSTGLKIGQIIRSTVPGVDNTRITSVSAPSGAATIGFNGTAGATLGSTISVYDVISIDGVELDAHTPETLINALGAAMIAGTVQTLLFAAPTLDLSSSSVEGQALVFQNSVPPESFTIKATNGQNYSPPLAEYSGAAQTSTADPRTDRVSFSEVDQPENVPPANRFLVGSGVILKLWATQDSLFAFCTDGIFRIDGDGDDWSVKPFDPDTILLAPDAVDSMDNNIYAFTTAGLVSITDSGGVRKISAPYIDEDLRELWNLFSDGAIHELPYTWGVQLICDKHRHEAWLNFNDYGIDGDGFIQTWIWNSNTQTFVTQSDQETLALTYAPFLRSMLTSTTNIFQYDTDNWMETNVEFNSVFAEDLGLLKQWIDVTLFFEDLTENADMTPRFEGLEYPDGYTIEDTAGAFDHVIAPLLTAICNKHMRFGYFLTAAGDSGNPYYKLKGLSYRYRLAAEPLTR